jgi:hypothetical protein
MGYYILEGYGAAVDFHKRYLLFDVNIKTRRCRFVKEGRVGLEEIANDRRDSV